MKSTIAVMLALVSLSSANTLFASGSQCGIITTVAGTLDEGGFTTSGYSGDGGPATQAKLYTPIGIAVDAKGNLYIADHQNHRVRKVDSQGTITTIAGTGTPGFNGDNKPATQADLNNPVGVVVDSQGNLYIADHQNHRVRKVDSQGTITTIAGTGEQGFSGDGEPATQAKLYAPAGIALDSQGNLYIGDTWYDPNYSSVRKINPQGVISTVAGMGEEGFSGDGGLAIQAKLNFFNGIAAVAADSQGNFYLGDTHNYRVRKVDPMGTINTTAGSGTEGHQQGTSGGPATQSNLSWPAGVAVDSQGNLYIADSSGNNRVLRVDPLGNISTVAGTANGGFNGDGGLASQTQLNFPHGLAFDSQGNLYIADSFNHLVRKVTCPQPPPPVCGNGIVESGEECDDGNMTNGDGCSEVCKTETSKETPPELPFYEEEQHRFIHPSVPVEKRVLGTRKSAPRTIAPKWLLPKARTRVR